MHIGRLRLLAQQICAAAADDSALDIGRKALAASLTRLYLRQCTHVGLFAVVNGRPRVSNAGTLIIGQRVLIASTVVPTELKVFKGGTLEIGDSTFINYGCSIQATGQVRIGRHCLLGMYSIILDNDFHQIENHNMRPQPRPVVLEDNVWMGNRVIVLPGVTIGHDAVIGAGAVVVKDVPPRSVAVGNPARVVKTF